MNIPDDFIEEIVKKVEKIRNSLIIKELDKSLNKKIIEYEVIYKELAKKEEEETNKHLKKLTVGEISTEDFAALMYQSIKKEKDLLFNYEQVSALISELSSVNGFKNITLEKTEIKDSQETFFTLVFNDNNFRLEYDMSSFPKEFYKNLYYDLNINEHEFDIEINFFDGRDLKNIKNLKVNVGDKDNYGALQVLLRFNKNKLNCENFYFTEKDLYFDKSDNTEQDNNFINLIVNENLLNLDSEEIKDLALCSFDIDLNLKDNKTYEIFKTGFNSFILDVCNQPTINIKNRAKK